MKIILDKIIEFQCMSDGENEDADGFATDLWITYIKTMAKVNNLYGKEFWSAKSVQSEETIEFTMRYVKELENISTKKHRILYNNELYDIKHIDNIRHENTWIKIKAITKS